MKVSYGLRSYLIIQSLLEISKRNARMALREVHISLEHCSLSYLRRTYCRMLKDRRAAQYARTRAVEIADSWLGMMILEAEVAK